MQAKDIYTTTTTDELESILYYIYMHTSRTSGKSYIGVSYDVKKRKQVHKNEAFNTNSHTYNTHFKRAIRKYGIDDFDTKILWCTPTKKTAYLAEVYYIAVYDTFNGTGYNGTAGGENPPDNKNRKHTKQSRVNMSKGQKGKKHSQEAKDKIRQSSTGRTHSQETKDNISKSKLGTKHHYYGKKLSTKHKNKMSKASLGHKKSKSHVQNIINAKSKLWLITFPDNHTEIIKNLTKFCKDNNLSQGNMCNVAHGKCKQHKGFKCKKLS